MSKQKFKGKTLYTKTCVNNIVQVWDKVPADIKQDNWYGEARNLVHNLAHEHGVSPIKVAGVIAALSPQKSWEENIKLANNYMQTGKAGHTGAMLKKCRAIMQLGEDNLYEDIAMILNGNKITSFFLNIVDPDNIAVTIDRHAQDIALGRVNNEDREMTDRQYDFFSNCYRIAAKKCGTTPYQMQAATWVYWRVAKKQ